MDVQPRSGQHTAAVLPRVPCAHPFGRLRHLLDVDTLTTESVFDVRMLHMLTDSAMAATGDEIEGTTFVRVKILYYHDMLPFPLPIHLY